MEKTIAQKDSEMKTAPNETVKTFP